MMILFVLAASCLLCLVGWGWFWGARLRQARSERVAESIQVMIGAHGLWGGVWLAEVAESLVVATSQQTSKAVASGTEPKALARLWRAAGARLVAHLPGPAMTTVAEGCGWLRYVSKDLSRSPLLGPLTLRSRRLLAIVYVSRDAPRTDRHTWEDVEQLLGRRACRGSAFVVLPDAGQGVPDGRRSMLLALTIAASLGLLLAAGLAAYVVSQEVGASKTPWRDHGEPGATSVPPLSGSPNTGSAVLPGADDPAPPGPPPLLQLQAPPTNAGSAPSHAHTATGRSSTDPRVGY